VLDLGGLSKSFGPVRALERVSFQVERGTIHGVVGQNGAGKSTLMQILAGVFPPDEGEIVLAGEAVAPRDPDHARRLGIRIIFQELNLVPYQTVAENVSLGVEPRTRLGLLDRRAMRRRAHALLRELGHPLPADAKVDTLDVSEQQIVEIAKALAADARLLILDEPTAALQMGDVDRLFEVLRRFRGRGGSALYVSHRLDEVFELCDRVTVLRDGHVIATLEVGATDKAAVIAMMIGRPLTEVFPERSHDDGAPVVLAARGISSHILRDVSFATRAGRVLGIIGLEGSGIHELGRLPERRPQKGWDVPDPLGRAQHRARDARRQAPPWAGRLRGRAPARRAEHRAARDPHAERRSRDPLPLRRQSAEGAAGALPGREAGPVRPR
jgi:ABC-type sugar transport system ATPase subunit